MFDLNAMSTGGSSIFNGGNAGLVKNVTIDVEKKPAGDSSNQPDYKLLVSDDNGTINAGFYYFKPYPSATEEDNKKAETRLVGRVLHIARAVMADEESFDFPAVSSSKEALDVLFKIIKQNAEGKKFNVYATYGTQYKPSKYLGLRYFDFIEPADSNTLKPNKNDMLERIQEDEPVATADGDFGSTSGSEDVETWG